LIITFASLVCLFVLLLSIPIGLKFNISKEPSIAYHTRLIWLFGLIKKDLPGVRKKRRVKKVVKAKQKRKFNRRNIIVALKITRIRGLPRHLYRFIKGVIRVIKLDEFELELDIGLDDPAETAFLFMYLGPITVFLNLISSGSIIIRPSVNHPVIYGHLFGRLSVRPILMMPPLLRFLLSWTTVRIIILLIRKR
jgi:hypothetical protein